MEQKSKKIDVKIIVIITIVVIIAIVEGIVIFTSGNKSNNGKLTQEEQLAVDYLLCNTLISPRDIELYRVWIYQEGDKYYFAYDMTEPQSLIFNSRQIIYASEGGVTKKQIENKEIKEFQSLVSTCPNAKAKEKGKQLNAEKIYNAMLEQW